MPGAPFIIGPQAVQATPSIPRTVVGGGTVSPSAFIWAFIWQSGQRCRARLGLGGSGRPARAAVGAARARPSTARRREVRRIGNSFPKLDPRAECLVPDAGDGGPIVSPVVGHIG